MDSLASASIVDDARQSFDYYLAATKDFKRFERIPDGTSFIYPEETIQVDAAAFAGTFTCLWRAIEGSMFDQYYLAKAAAFLELARIVTPNPGDSANFARYVQFWTHDIATPVTSREGMRSLCRTLRDGLAHFNFRYINVKPREYFRTMHLLLPSHILDPDEATNYRMFICDWNTRNGTFMDPRSNTRIIETEFAHFRYHLFLFFARFFSDANHQYRNILTGKPIT